MANKVLADLCLSYTLPESRPVRRIHQHPRLKEKKGNPRSSLIIPGRVCRAQSSGGKKSTSKTTKAAPKPAAAADGASADANNTTDDPLTSSASAVGVNASFDAVPDPKEKKGRSKGDCLYYRVKCKDNGVGMPHDKVGSPHVRLLKGSLDWSQFCVHSGALTCCRKAGVLDLP